MLCLSLVSLYWSWPWEQSPLLPCLLTLLLPAPPNFCNTAPFLVTGRTILAPLRIKMYCKSSRKNLTFSCVSHQYTVGIKSSTIDQTCMKFVDYHNGAHWYGTQWYIAYPLTKAEAWLSYAHHLRWHTVHHLCKCHLHILTIWCSLRQNAWPFS